MLLVLSTLFLIIGSATTRKVIKLDDDAEDTSLVAKKSQSVQGGLKTSNVSATLDYLKKGKGKNETMAPPSPYYRPSPVYGQSHGTKRNKRRPLSYLPPPSVNVSNMSSASAPVKYQTQESQGNQSHDKGGQFDYKPQARSVRYEEAVSPQLQARLSDHPVSSEKGFLKMTVYEDGSKMYWDKVINVTDYSAPTLRAAGSTQPGFQSPKPLLNQLQRNEPAKLQVNTSNTPNSVKNNNWKRGRKTRMISRPASSEVHVSTPLNKPVPNNQLVSPLLAASPSVLPVSNPSVTVAKSRTPPKSYPPEVLHGFTDFHDTPPAPLISKFETSVNKPKPKEPYSVSVAPVSATTATTTTTTSGSSLTGSLAKPLESFVNKCLLHKQKYSTTCLKYSGSFSVDMMKYMSPKKPTATNAKADKYYVPPSKTSTPLFGQKSTSSTPLFYRSTSKEEVATVPPSSHFSLDRLSTNSTQFKLNHL